MAVFLIVPWIVSGGLAYWKMETNDDQLKKLDSNLYEELKKDENGEKAKELKAKIPDLKNEVKDLEAKIKAADETLKNNADDETAKNEKKESQESLDKKKLEITVYENLDKKSWMPVMSFSNIAWVLGIFLGVGLIGHLITKQILKMFSDSSSSK